MRTFVAIFALIFSIFTNVCLAEEDHASRNELKVKWDYDNIKITLNLKNGIDRAQAKELLDAQKNELVKMGMARDCVFLENEDTLQYSCVMMNNLPEEETRYNFFL